MALSEDPESIATTDGRVPGRRGLATRQRLIEQTAELLLATPWRSIKVIDIARAAGTSPATFYQYFENVEAVITVLAEELVEGVAWCQQRAGSGGRDRYRAGLGEGAKTPGEHFDRSGQFRLGARDGIQLGVELFGFLRWHPGLSSQGGLPFGGHLLLLPSGRASLCAAPGVPHPFDTFQPRLKDQRTSGETRGQRLPDPVVTTRDTSRSRPFPDGRGRS